jgi:hypothetical protein
MPGNSTPPGNDPMCFDKNAMAWAMARGAKRSATGQSGIHVHASGGSDASNTDPFAKKLVNGADWLKTGPHIMVVERPIWPDPATDQTSLPYIMWPGTPLRI